MNPPLHNSSSRQHQFDTKYSAAHPPIVEADIKVYSILPAAHATSSVTLIEMDSKCAKEHLEALTKAEIIAVSEIKNRKFILSPKTIATDEFSCGLKDISISLGELQKYILEKKFPSDPSKMQKGFIVGGMATFLLMSHRTPSPPVEPADIDTCWYIGKDFLNFKDYVFDYFWDKFKITQATLCNYYLKNPTVTITDDFILFQFPEIDIKFVDKQTGSRSNISYSDGFQYSFNENYLIAIDNGVICNQANFERAVYAAKHYQYPIDNWDASDRRELIFRILQKMTHGQFITPKIEMFIGLIKKILVDIDTYQFTEKFKKKFNKSDSNHFEKWEYAQAIHFLNALQLGCEARVDRVAALALGEYSNALAAAWNDKDREDPWSTKKAWKSNAKPRLLTGFAGLIQSPHVQSDIEIIPKFLNVFRGIFLLEWMDSVKKGNEKITAYSFPFSSKEHPIRMQFGLKSTNEPNISYLALEEHHDPYTIAKDFIQSWQELDSSLPKIYSETFQALPCDLGISQLRLTKENRQKLILELIKAFSTGPIANKIRELFKEKSTIDFSKFILESATEDLDTSTYLKLHCEMLKLAKNEGAELQLKQLAGLEHYLQACAKSNNPFEDLLPWLEQCHRAINLKDPLNEILRISIKKVLIDQITKNKESFVSLALKENLVAILNFCKELTIISELEKVNFFMNFLEIKYKNDDIQNLLFTLSIDLELKKVKNPSYALRNLLRESETDALKKILDHYKKDLEIASFALTIDSLLFLTTNFMFLDLVGGIKKIIAFALKNPQGKFLTKAYKLAEAYLQRDNHLFLENELLDLFIDLAIALQKIPSSQLDKLPHSHYHALNSKLLSALITTLPKNERVKTMVFDQLIHKQMFDSLLLNEADVKSNDDHLVPNSLFQETIEAYLALTKAPKDMGYKFRDLVSTNVITEKERPEIFSKLIKLVCVQHPVQALKQLISLHQQKLLGPLLVEDLACFIIHKPAINGLAYRYDAWKILTENKEKVVATLPHILNKISASIHILNTSLAVSNAKLESLTKEIFLYLIQTFAIEQEKFKKISAAELEGLNAHISQALQHLSKITPELGLELSEHLFKVADQCEIKLKNQSTTFFKLLHTLKSQHPEKVHDQKLIVKLSETDNKQIIEDICNLINNAVKDSSSLPYAIIAATKLLQSSLIPASWHSFAPTMLNLINVSSNANANGISSTDFKQLIQTLIGKNLVSTMPAGQKLQLLKLTVATNDSLFLNTFWQKVKAELSPSLVLFDLTKMMSQGFNNIEKSGILPDAFSIFIQQSQLNNAEEIQRISKEFHGYLISTETDTKINESSVTKASRTYQLLNLLTIQQIDQDRKYPIEKATANNYCAAVVNGFAAFNKKLFPYLTSQLSKRPDLTNHFLDVIRGILFTEAHKKPTNAGPNPVTAFLFSLEGAQDEIRSQICDNRHGQIFNLELLKNQDPIDLASRFISSWRTLLIELKGEDLKHFYSIGHDLEISNNFMLKENLPHTIQQLLELLHTPGIACIVKHIGHPTSPTFFYESLFSSNDKFDLPLQLALHIHYFKLIAAKLEHQKDFDEAAKYVKMTAHLKELEKCSTKPDLESIWNWLQSFETNVIAREILIDNDVLENTIKVVLRNLIEKISPIQNFQCERLYNILELSRKLTLFDAEDCCSIASIILSAYNSMNAHQLSNNYILSIISLLDKVSTWNHPSSGLSQTIKELEASIIPQIIPRAKKLMHCCNEIRDATDAAKFLSYVAQTPTTDKIEAIAEFIQLALIQKTGPYLRLAGNLTLKFLAKPKSDLPESLKVALLDLAKMLIFIRKSQLNENIPSSSYISIGTKVLISLTDIFPDSQEAAQNILIEKAAQTLTKEQEIAISYDDFAKVLDELLLLKRLPAVVSSTMQSLKKLANAKIDYTKFLCEFLLGIATFNLDVASKILQDTKLYRQLPTTERDSIAFHLFSISLKDEIRLTAAYRAWCVIRATARESQKDIERLNDKFTVSVDLLSAYTRSPVKNAAAYVLEIFDFILFLLHREKKQFQSMDSSTKTQLNTLSKKVATELVAMDSKLGLEKTEELFSYLGRALVSINDRSSNYLESMNTHLSMGLLPTEANNYKFLNQQLNSAESEEKSNIEYLKTALLLIQKCLTKKQHFPSILAAATVKKLLDSPLTKPLLLPDCIEMLNNYIKDQLDLDLDLEGFVNGLIKKDLAKRLSYNSLSKLLALCVNEKKFNLCAALWPTFKGQPSSLIDQKHMCHLICQSGKADLISMIYAYYAEQNWNPAYLSYLLLQVAVKTPNKSLLPLIKQHIIEPGLLFNSHASKDTSSPFQEDKFVLIFTFLSELILSERSQNVIAECFLILDNLFEKMSQKNKLQVQALYFEAYLNMREQSTTLKACNILTKLSTLTDPNLCIRAVSLILGFPKTDESSGIITKMLTDILPRFGTPLLYDKKYTDLLLPLLDTLLMKRSAPYTEWAYHLIFKVLHNSMSNEPDQKSIRAEFPFATSFVPIQQSFVGKLHGPLTTVLISLLENLSSLQELQKIQELMALLKEYLVDEWNGLSNKLIDNLTRYCEQLKKIDVADINHFQGKINDVKKLFSLCMACDAILAKTMLEQLLKHFSTLNAPLINDILEIVDFSYPTLQTFMTKWEPSSVNALCKNPRAEVLPIALKRIKLLQNCIHFKSKEELNGFLDLILSLHDRIFINFLGNSNPALYEEIQTILLNLVSSKVFSTHTEIVANFMWRIHARMLAYPGIISEIIHSAKAAKEFNKIEITKAQLKSFMVDNGQNTALSKATIDRRLKLLELFPANSLKEPSIDHIISQIEYFEGAQSLLNAIQQTTFMSISKQLFKITEMWLDKVASKPFTSAIQSIIIETLYEIHKRELEHCSAKYGCRDFEGVGLYLRNQVDKILLKHPQLSKEMLIYKMRKISLTFPKSTSASLQNSVPIDSHNVWSAFEGANVSGWAPVSAGANVFANFQEMSFIEPDSKAFHDSKDNKKSDAASTATATAAAGAPRQNNKKKKKKK